jgi:hypothetical protein
MNWRIVVGLVLILTGLMVYSAGANAQEGPPLPDDAAAASDEGESGSSDVEEKAEEDKAEEDKAEEESAEVESEGEVKKGVVILKKSVPEKARRSPFTVLGAAPMDREDTAVRVAVGFPEVQALYHMPWDTDLEFGIGCGFFYGFNAMTAGDVAGGMVLGEGRWRFFKEDEHSLALVANPGLMMGAGDASAFLTGLVIGFPGIVYDYAIQGDNHAILGFNIPWGLFVGDVTKTDKTTGKKSSDTGFSARIPFVLKMGMEFAVSPEIHIFATAEMGLDVWTGEAPLPDGSGAYFFARGLAGAAFVL